MRTILATGAMNSSQVFRTRQHEGCTGYPLHVKILSNVIHSRNVPGVGAVATRLIMTHTRSKPGALTKVIGAANLHEQSVDIFGVASNQQRFIFPRIGLKVVADVVLKSGMRPEQRRGIDSLVFIAPIRGRIAGRVIVRIPGMVVTLEEKL